MYTPKQASATGATSTTAAETTTTTAESTKSEATTTVSTTKLQNVYHLKKQALRTVESSLKVFYTDLIGTEVQTFILKTHKPTRLLLWIYKFTCLDFWAWLPSKVN